MTENDEQFQPRFGLLPQDGLRLLRLFMTIESKHARDQVVQMVEAYVKLLEQNGLEDKPLKPED